MTFEELIKGLPEQELEEVTELVDRAKALLHAVQSGVRMLEELGASKECEPVHLRVGVNSALVSGGALVRLLVTKGIITPREIAEAECTMLEQEVTDYEKRLAERLGTKVSLH